MTSLPGLPIQSVWFASFAKFKCSERNVMGMMPHPERASDPLMGSTDGLAIFQSVLHAVVQA